MKWYEEKLKIGDFITGKIVGVKTEEEHEFKYEGNITKHPAVRFELQLDGYEFNHFTHWGKHYYGDRTNLYKKYISKLIENAKPDTKYDLNCLVGMKVKTIWEGDEYQRIESIYPNPDKVSPAKEEELKEVAKGQVVRPEQKQIKEETEKGDKEDLITIVKENRDLLKRIEVYFMELSIVKDTMSIDTLTEEEKSLKTPLKTITDENKADIEKKMGLYHDYISEEEFYTMLKDEGIEITDKNAGYIKEAIEKYVKAKIG